MRSILILAVKDLRLLSRDWFGMLWILVFPLIFALFFGSIAGGGDRETSPLAIAVVDQDRSRGSENYITKLKGKKNTLAVEDLALDSARAKVRKGELAAFVLLKPGFGEAGGIGPAQTPALELGIDPRRRAEAGMLQGLLMETYFETRYPGFKKTGEPVKVVEVAREGRGWLSPFEVTFPSAILWGIMGCAAAFAISIVTERVAGTFLRLRVAPLSWGQLLAGKGLACFLASVAVAVLLLLLGNLVFRVRLDDPAGLLVAIICTGCCFVGIMMLLATLGKTEQSVAGAGWGILTLLAMFGGGMVPLVFMPGWMQTASNISPVKWGILALEGSIWRGFSWADMLLPCAVLLGIGAAGFVLGVKNLARAEA
jgi:ABC-2 type transport system permease protein